MVVNRRSKRRRSSNSSISSHNNTNANRSAERNTKTRTLSSKANTTNTISNTNDGGSDGDEVEIHILDGVEYTNYTDFVAAKRRRNENYLKDLGFHKETKPKRSQSSAKETETTLQEETITALPRGKLVTPVSSYYERYSNQDDDEHVGFGISLDGASHRTDPFDDLSSVLLQVQGEQERRLGQSHSTESKEEQSSNTQPMCCLLEKLLARVTTTPASTSNDDGSKREGYLKAFHQLKGVALLLWIVRTTNHIDEETENSSNDQNNDNDTENSSRVTCLCLQILRNVCCLSVLPATPSSGELPSPSKPPSTTEEALALDLLDDSGLELLYVLASSMTDVVDSRIVPPSPASTTTSQTNSPKPKRRAGRPRKGASKAGSKPKAVATTHEDSTHPHSMPPVAVTPTPPTARTAHQQRQLLDVVRDAWSVYASLTYFESVTASMGKETLFELADLAYWTVAALDCRVTEELAKFLPLAGSDSHGNALARTTHTEIGVHEQTQTIVSEASHILEPVLGTIRNLVADPVATPLDWEAKSLVSKLLDILCKGGDEEDALEASSSPPPSIEAAAHDLLHFVKHTYNESSPRKAAPNENAAATALIPSRANRTIFRWMEERQSTVLELLGVFKVCLGKGILLTCTHDVERLVRLWVRFLQRFGPSSSRIVVKILGLAEGLVVSSATTTTTMSIAASYRGDESVRKQILLRGGFVKELVHLSSMYSWDGRRDRLSSDGEMVRTEIETMIARLR